MSDRVIRAEGVGKRFVIGHRVQNNALFADAMVSAARRFFSKGKSALKGNHGVTGDVFEEFWALRDVNFEIKRGELVSIIGHNGAGKSTLLKILSRITEPTTGRIEIDGRVTSLLEVGTGFHPELTGRENVFLNGAILGMTRAEVRHRFDEIVAFAGVEKFIDTPVKRYSVGMYARLAFAVAAHLEAEILVIDEVLAVGDAEFQQRCLNRMSQVASSGRTVLFVSHNLGAVSALTRRAIVLRAGQLTFDGPVQAALAHYTANVGKRPVAASELGPWTGSGHWFRPICSMGREIRRSDSNRARRWRYRSSSTPPGCPECVSSWLYAMSSACRLPSIPQEFSTRSRCRRRSAALNA